MSKVSINPHIEIDPDQFREEILSLITARDSLTITIEDKSNIDSVIEMMDNILEIAITVEEKRK